MLPDYWIRNRSQWVWENQNKRSGFAAGASTSFLFSTTSIAMYPAGICSIKHEMVKKSFDRIATYQMQWFHQWINDLINPSTHFQAETRATASNLAAAMLHGWTKNHQPKCIIKKLGNGLDTKKNMRTFRIPVFITSENTTETRVTTSMAPDISSVIRFFSSHQINKQALNWNGFFTFFTIHSILIWCKNWLRTFWHLLNSMSGWWIFCFTWSDKIGLKNINLHATIQILANNHRGAETTIYI